MIFEMVIQMKRELVDTERSICRKKDEDRIEVIKISKEKQKNISIQSEVALQIGNCFCITHIIRTTRK